MVVRVFGRLAGMAEIGVQACFVLGGEDVHAIEVVSEHAFKSFVEILVGAACFWETII